MADAELNFNSVHILLIFLLPKHPFILRLSFLSKILRFILVLIEMK